MRYNNETATQQFDKNIIYINTKEILDIDLNETATQQLYHNSIDMNTRGCYDIRHETTVLPQNDE